MAKGNSNRRTGSSRTSSGRAGGGSSQSSSNSRMWSQPATPRQKAALKANGNDDGKYYSKGRAGQTIGESVRSAGTAPSPKPRSGGGRAVRGPLPAPSRPPTAELVAISALQPSAVRADTVPAPPAMRAPAGSQPSPAAEGGSGLREFFALFDELEERCLTNLQAQLSSYAGDVLRREITAWADFRIKVFNMWAGAHAAVVAILGEAPLGSIPDPANAASGLLDAASPHQLEEQHLRSLQAQLSSYAGDVLRREIKAWLTTRIELATKNARELVRALNEQGQLAPVTEPSGLPAAPSLHASKTTPGDERRARSNPPRRRTTPAGKGRTYTGTVLRIKPHGVLVSLDSGEQGWLHVSHVRRLNGGVWVESVSDVLMVGQELRLRSIGTTDRGQVELALVDSRASKPAGSNTTAAASEPSDDVPPTAAESRRGGRRWFGFGRNEQDGT